MQTNTEALNPLFSIQALVQEINTVQKTKTVPTLELIAKHISGTFKSVKQSVSKTFFDVSKAFSNNNLQLDKSKTKIHVEFFKDIKSLNDIKKINITLWNLLRLVQTKPEQLQKTSEFFKGLTDILSKLGNKAFKVAFGITALAVSFALFGFVNLIAIAKAVVALKLLSLAVGGFISIIIKAVSKAGIIKTFFVLRQIPDILHELGFAVAAISIGLFLTNNVDWSAVGKLTTAIVSLGLAARFISEKGSFGTAFLLITLSFAILSMTNALKRFTKIEWTSILKFPVFLAGLGLSFKIWNKTKLGLLTVLGISLMMIALSLFELKFVSWTSALILPPFILALGFAFRAFNKDTTPLKMITFAVSFMIFTLAFDMLTDVDVQAVWWTVTAIVGLGAALKFLLQGGASSTFGVNVEGNYISVLAKSILAFAVGIGILIYVFNTASWQSIIAGVLAMTTVLSVLGVVLKKLDGTNGSFTINKNINRNLQGRKKQTPPIIRFALGLAILLITIDAYNELSWTGALQVIMFIGVLSTLFILLDKIGKNGRAKAPSGLFGFSIGLAILLLTIDAFNEIEWSAAFKLLGFIALLGLALQLFPKRGIKGFFLFSLGLLVIQGVLWLISNTNYSIDNITVFVTTTAILIGMFVLINKFFGSIVKASIAVFLMAIPLMMLSNTLRKVGGSFSLDYFENVMLFIVSVGALGAVFSLLSLISVPILIGSGAMLILALTTILAAESLKMINNHKINVLNVEMFMKSIETLSIGLFKNFGYILGALIPATMLIPVSLSLLVTAGLIALISNMTIDNVSIVQFTDGIKNIITNLNNISLDNLAESVIKSALLIPISASMLLAAGTIALISKINVKVENVYNFGKALKQLVDRINDLSGWNLGKTAFKAALLLPISGVALLAATALRGIAMLNIQPEAIQKFGESLSLIVEVLAKSFDDNKKILTSAGFVEGMKSIKEIINSISMVPKIFTDVANMRFGVYEVKDGKLVMVDSLPFNNDIMKKVGDNLYLMMEGLTNTMQSVMKRLGSSSLVSTIQSNLLLKGISDTISPIVGIFKQISEVPFLSNESETQKVLTSFDIFTNGVSDVFMKIGTTELKNSTFIAKDVSWNIGQFFNYITKYWNTDIIQKPTDILFKFVDTLSDSQKWQKIQKNLKQLKDDFWSISKAINNINLEKATKLDNLLYKLTERNSSYTLQQILEELKELIGLIYEKQNVSYSDNSGSGNSENSTNQKIINNITNQNNSTVNNKPKDSNEILQRILEYLEGMQLPVVPNVQKVFVTNKDSIGY
nr:MAG TPA: hypothetical protein [Caudoviricetes sp.]